MWTYCYGFYLEGALEKSIFEQHQERLEKFTEHLHGLSEMPIQELLDNKIRADIVNYTRVSLRVNSLIHLSRYHIFSRFELICVCVVCVCVCVWPVP